MNILLTGASSFTGFWFAKSLVAAGHRVVATFTRDAECDYGGDDVRGRRVRQLAAACQREFGTCFGDERFLALLDEQPYDVLAHHAAYVKDYRQSDFDFAHALSSNTQNLAAVCRTLARTGCQRLLLTGTVFEGGEGVGSNNLPHFSPYGLSKALTAEVFSYFCQQHALRFSKFVIPNPFGPFEEPRFCHYLMRCWRNHETAVVNTPAYVRDNIHVSLLAAAYVKFAENLCAEPGVEKLHPSGYVESQGAFAQRFAQELSGRLQLACPLELACQTEFSEPYIRINTLSAAAYVPHWQETAAWDDVADYYAV